MFLIETERLKITEFTPDMAYMVHRNSLDEDNRRFVPDEVFETEAEALETIEFLMTQYGDCNGPRVYPILLSDNTNIGYVQAVPLEDTWEIGYHIAKAYTGKGYASEAVRAFLPVIMPELNLQQIEGVCLEENLASRKVMERSGFVLIYKGIGDYQGEKRQICRYRFKL